MLKCLAIFAAVLATFGSLEPVPGQTANHRNNGTQQPENQTEHSKNPPSPTLAVTIPKDCDSEALKNDPDCKKAKDKESTVAVSKLPTANVTIERNAKRDIFGWIAYAGSLLLVIVGMVGVFVGWRTLGWLRVQTTAAQNAAQAALDQTILIKAKERARITVSILRLETLYIGIEPGNKIIMQVENIGPTQAQNVKGEAEATILIDGFDSLNTRDIEMQDVVFENVMRPNQQPIDTYLFFFIPEQWSEEIGIVNPRITITIRGIVQYEDIFGEQHTTPFKYIFLIPKILKWLGNDVAETHPFSQWRQDGSPEENLAT